MAKKEMTDAVARHRRTCGTEPVAVLSAEQADYVTAVTRRYFSYGVVTLRRKAEGALVVGRSRGDLMPEIAFAPEPYRADSITERQPLSSPGRRRSPVTIGMMMIVVASHAR